MGSISLNIVSELQQTVLKRRSVIRDRRATSCRGHGRAYLFAGDTFIGSTHVERSLTFSVLPNWATHPVRLGHTLVVHDFKHVAIRVLEVEAFRVPLRTMRPTGPRHTANGIEVIAVGHIAHL